MRTDFGFFVAVILDGSEWVEHFDWEWRKFENYGCVWLGVWVTGEVVNREISWWRLKGRGCIF